MEQQQIENTGAVPQPQLEVPNYQQIALEAGQAADAARAERQELYAQSAFQPAVEAEQVENGLADAKKAREDAIYQKALGRSEDEIYDNAYTDAYLKAIKGTMDGGHYLESAGETAKRHEAREPAAAEAARQHAEDELRMARRNAETEVEADRLWQSTYANKLQELGATEIADTNDPNDMFHNAALDAADEAVAKLRYERKPRVDKISDLQSFGLGVRTGREDAAEDRAAAATQPKVKATAEAKPADDPDGDKNAQNKKFAPGVYQSIFAGENRTDFQQELAEQASERGMSGVEAIAADLLHTAEETRDDDPRRNQAWNEYRTFMRRNNLPSHRIHDIVDDVQLVLNPPAAAPNLNTNGGTGGEDDDELEIDENSARRNRLGILSKESLARGWQKVVDSGAWAETKRAGGDLAWLFRKLVGNRAVAADQQQSEEQPEAVRPVTREPAQV